jgi:DNA-binding CsgD family transcriptional regulator
MGLIDSQVWIYSESSDPPEFVKKNCWRCGLDFDAYGTARVCAPCRKEAKGRNRFLSRFGDALTLRENQIVELLSEGHSNKEIAYRLHLTEGTVKVYVSNIFDKTGFSSRFKLGLWHCRKSDKSSQPE